MNVSSVFQPEIKNCSKNMYMPVWNTPFYPWFGYSFQVSLP